MISDTYVRRHRIALAHYEKARIHRYLEITAGTRDVLMVKRAIVNEECKMAAAQIYLSTADPPVLGALADALHHQQNALSIVDDLITLSLPHEEVELRLLCADVRSLVLLALRIACGCSVLCVLCILPI